MLLRSTLHSALWCVFCLDLIEIKGYFDTQFTIILPNSAFQLGSLKSKLHLISIIAITYIWWYGSVLGHTSLYPSTWICRKPELGRTCLLKSLCGLWGSESTTLNTEQSRHHWQHTTSMRSDSVSKGGAGVEAGYIVACNGSRNSFANWMHGSDSAEPLADVSWMLSLCGQTV